ncbi:Nicotinate-nucleotide adenylyltransferase [bacterium HR40]|nr:Nicotinate-nucleotide adenylyltransferase [bacterium HR40]
MVAALSQPKRRGTTRLLLPEDSHPPAVPEGRPRLVGLLGGSFNPAHRGHRYISVEALDRLGLDEVWWLVSPRNPLKPAESLLPYAERVRRAERECRHPRIRVSRIEERLGTRYTVDTLSRLVRLPGFRFVWLMGADNLAQLPQWRHWRRIFALVPIAVFERAPYSYGALAGKAAQAFARARMAESAVRRLAWSDPPCWVFVRLRPDPTSATAIREAWAKTGSGGPPVGECEP